MHHTLVTVDGFRIALRFGTVFCAAPAHRCLRSSCPGFTDFDLATEAVTLLPQHARTS